MRMRRSAIVIQQAVRIWIGERKRSENIEPFESHEFLETAAPLKTDCIQMCDGENETPPCKDLGTSIASAAPQCLDESNRIDTVTILQLRDENSNYVTYPSAHRSIVKNGSVNSISQHLCQIETASIASATKLMCKDDVHCGSNISCGASFQHEQPVSSQHAFLLRKDVMAVQKIQFAYRRFVHNRSSRISAATKIQSHWRGFTMQMCLTKQVEAIIVIQSVARRNLCSWAFQRHHNAALDIQRIARGRFARKQLLG